MTIEIKTPVLGESVAEASIAKIHKKAGSVVKTDEILFELETDKVTLEVNSPSSGTITEIKFNEGDSVKVGDILALLQEGASNQASVAEVATKPVVNTANSATNNIHLSPAPQKLVAENNLNPQNIDGTGN